MRVYLELGRAGKLLLAEQARADLSLLLRRLDVQRFFFVLQQCIQAATRSSKGGTIAEHNRNTRGSACG